MCHRFIPLTLEQVEEALANLRQGRRATVSRRPGGTGAGIPVAGAPGTTGRPSAGASGTVRDAYPGSRVPVIVPGDFGRPAGALDPTSTANAGDGMGSGIHPGLQTLLLTWGFDQPRNAAGGPSAEKPADGPAGKVIFNARLDTATRQLREGRGMWAEAIARGRCLIPVRAFYEQTSGAIPKRVFRFSLAGSSLFLLAGIAQDGRFSLVTTAPNAQVAPVHNRMPLVLGPGESAAWLAGDFARLADRSRVRLDVEEERDEDGGQSPS